MNVNLSALTTEHDVIAVALSGGSDSMALLYYMLSQAEKYHFTVIALNVEHGIRGEASLSDTEFVKNYCKAHNVPLLSYSVNAKELVATEKISLEESARILRYQCFYDAINNGKCTKIATAHHLRDNAESVLFNLLRGTGLKGVSGITPSFENKIIRPFLTVSKEEIEQYILDNNIPYVTDESNFDTDYTRNFIRANVLPELKKAFPEAEKSISRFSEIARIDNEFLDLTAKESVTISDQKAEILLPLHPAILSRATVIALKSCGIQKDWEKVHIDSIIALEKMQNGAKVSLPKNVTAIREYDRIVFYKPYEKPHENPITYPFERVQFGKNTITATTIDPQNIDLKSGLIADANKIPSTAIIRYRKDGDVFTKFGGGTKKLNDYFTDKKIPQRLRDSIPLLASDNVVYVIFGIAVSDLVKVDSSTTNAIKFEIK